MKRTFLEGFGLDKEVIDKIMTENGNDIEGARSSEKSKFDNEKAGLQAQITDLQGQVTQRDSDLAALNEKLTAAQDDAGKLTEAQSTLNALQSKYDTERQEWEEKNRRQAYEFMVRERANSLEFSSTAAKKEFIREAIGKNFQTEGDTLLGFDDYVTKYKEADPGAFKTADTGTQAPPEDNKPGIVLPPQGANPVANGNGFGFHFNGVRPKPQE